MDPADSTLADLFLVESLCFHEAGLNKNLLPFSEEFQAAIVLERFTTKHLKLYAGTSDMVAHVEYFCRAMDLYQCCANPSTSWEQAP